MNFDDCLNEGRVFKVVINKLRADSLFKSSAQCVDSSKLLPLNDTTSKSILRELYEGLRQHCEGLGYLKGFKFSDHESIVCFIRDILKNDVVSLRFDRYRRLRNGINYYGDDDLETVKEAVVEIPDLIKKLKP